MAGTAELGGSSTRLSVGGGAAALGCNGGVGGTMACATSSRFNTGEGPDLLFFEGAKNDFILESIFPDERGDADTASPSGCATTSVSVLAHGGSSSTLSSSGITGTSRFIQVPKEMSERLGLGRNRQKSYENNEWKDIVGNKNG
jgi:hypothetical protein